MERSVQARLGCLRGRLHAAMARLTASHERAHAELAAVQAELLAVLGKGWMKAPFSQIKAPGDQSIRDCLDRSQAEVQGQAELEAGWEAVRADWDTVQAAWEEVLTDAQGKAATQAPAQVPANTAQTLMAVACLQARFAQIQASCAEAQMEALQAQGKTQLTQAVSELVLKEVYAQVATAVHDILLMAMQDLEQAQQAQRLPLLSRLTRAVHAQVEMALRGILATAMQEVAAADRGQLAKALCSQVAKAVQDVIVKVEQDWGRPRGAQLEPAPGGSEGRGRARPGGEAALWRESWEGEVGGSGGLAG